MRIRHALTIIFATVFGSACVSTASGPQLTMEPIGHVIESLRTAYDAACAKPVNDPQFEICLKAFQALDAVVVEYDKVNEQVKASQ